VDKDLQKEAAIREKNRAARVAFPDGAKAPRLGQGTWHLGERPSRRDSEIEALRLGVRLGMTLIDTAEMYGEGRAESLVGEAIRGIGRNGLFLVSKVYPHNAGRKNIFESCENSLRRLGTDFLDLYLLHWRGNIPLAETVTCMEELVSRGLIRRWGVSNFDTADMEELWRIPGGSRCAANQVLYHLGSRGVEYDLLPWMRKHRVPLMAYCPIAQGGSLRRGLFENPAVRRVAAAHGATPAQVLLGFVMRGGDVIAIPKAGTPRHTLENAGAGLLALTDADLAALSAAYPAPAHKTALDMR
jgi:diketogulonate reductase-like aldo/keto reductase